MQDKAIHFTHEFIKYFLNLPTSSYYTFGTLVGLYLLGSVYIELRKHYYRYKHGEDLAKVAVGRLMVVVSSVIAFAGWAGVHGAAFTPLFPSYMASHILQALGGLLAVYRFGGSQGYKAFATTVNNWVANKNSLKNQLKPDVPAVAAPQPPEQPKTPTNIAW